MRLSGLQRDVLSLYRQCLRAIRQKPMVSDHQLENGLWFSKSNNEKDAQVNFRRYAR